MVAERAGVQRHTLYAHFPEEKSLLMACSGMVEARAPLPDAAPWRAIEDRHKRLMTGLRRVYGWFERNADLAGCVLRDAETNPLVREIAACALVRSSHAYHEVLGAKLNARQAAMLHLALSYFTWRSSGARRRVEDGCGRQGHG